MRVAVIVVSMLMVATPSAASQSCMSKTEARQHFGSMHIYWHGQACEGPLRVIRVDFGMSAAWPVRG
jgi:hypothetical protein